MLRSIRSLRQNVRRSYGGISTTSTAMLKVSHHHLFSQSFGGQEKIPTHRHITYAYHAQNKVRQSLASAGLLLQRYIYMVDTSTIACSHGVSNLCLLAHLVPSVWRSRLCWSLGRAWHFCTLAHCQFAHIKSDQVHVRIHAWLAKERNQLDTT